MNNHLQSSPPASELSSVLIGTYPPTECGIATYTANLRSGLDQAGLDCRVVRVMARGDTSDSRFPPEPNDEVVDFWLLDDPEGPERCARTCSRFDAVLLQHEFGIFPGPDGIDVVRFAEACRAPLFTVLHTALRAPTPSQREIIERVARHSLLLIVHSAVARARLVAAHDLDASRVVVVPHGATPNLAGPPALTSADPIVLTWGLLGPGKGVERGIRAVAQLRDVGLDVRYVVAGETHPNVRKLHGEAYRESLRELATELAVGDLVEFRGGYTSWEDLRAVVRSADVVLLPYDTRDQVTSGVLVEALAAGKPVIATAFPHAVELSRTGAVEVVEHDDDEAIADVLERIFADNRMRDRMQAAARAESAQYDWPIIGARIRNLIETSLRDIARVHPLAG
jgi:polysaccharide biosynthesis protein PslF